MESIINEIESLIDTVRALHPTKVVEEPKKRVKRVKAFMREIYQWKDIDRLDRRRLTRLQPKDFP